MKNYEYKFVLEDKNKLIRVYAFTQGWCKEWLASQEEAMEYLYERKFDKMEVAVHCVQYKSYPVDDHSCLDHGFLQAFFSGFPKVEILQRPDITFVSAPVSPKVAESYRYEDAWVYHIQTLILKKPEERIEYLYSYVPESLKKVLAEKAEKKNERLINITRRRD